MVHLCINLAELVEPSAQPIVDTLVIIGTEKGYIDHFSWVCSDILKRLLEGPDEAYDSPEAKKARVIRDDDKLLRSILVDLKPSLEAGVSTECWLPRSRPDTEKPLRIVLGVLPAYVSRHNSPSQPYAILQLLKKSVRSHESTAIVPLCESSEYIYSTMCAISRVGGALAYNRKTGASSSGGPAGGLDLKVKVIPAINDVLVVFPFPVDKSMQEKYALLSLGIQLTRRLVDAPCNELHTDAFTQQALDAVDGIEHVSSRVIKGEDLQEKGFGGLFSVGKAAEHPPAMVILMYEPPEAKGKKSIVMVGKGIVYDTGGLSMKTKTGMPGMKRDMGGAAATLAAFAAAIRSGVVKNRPLHAILCLAENAVSPVATRPDDVITMYSGKTVEVNNTDAEGRLVLGDGVASAVQHLNPEVIIDMATLTGAQGVATGKHFASIYCSDAGLESLTVEAGKDSGDLCHPVPYAPEFFIPEFKSSVADMKNSVANRANAQVSCAAQFVGNHLGDFLTNGGRWLHIDMAYCCFDEKDERANGWGVALLHCLIGKLDKTKTQASL